MKLATFIRRYCMIWFSANGPAILTDKDPYHLIQPVLKKTMFDGQNTLNFVCLCCWTMEENEKDFFQHFYDVHAKQTIKELDRLKQAENDRIMGEQDESNIIY